MMNKKFKIFMIALAMFFSAFSMQHDALDREAALDLLLNHYLWRYSQVHYFIYAINQSTSNGTGFFTLPSGLRLSTQALFAYRDDHVGYLREHTQSLKAEPNIILAHGGIAWRLFEYADGSKEFLNEQDYNKARMARDEKSSVLKIRDL